MDCGQAELGAAHSAPHVVDGGELGGEVAAESAQLEAHIGDAIGNRTDARRHAGVDVGEQFPAEAVEPRAGVTAAGVGRHPRLEQGQALLDAAGVDHVPGGVDQPSPVGRESVHRHAHRDEVDRVALDIGELAPQAQGHPHLGSQSVQRAADLTHVGVLLGQRLDRVRGRDRVGAVVRGRCPPR